MLKKLFISLIILSTLASEGIMNFPKEFYNFLSCLNVDTEFNVKESDQQPVTTNVSREIFSGAFRLTANSLKKITPLSNTGFSSSKYTNGNYNRTEIDFFTVSKAIFRNELPYDIKSIILYKSDNSPPLFI